MDPVDGEILSQHSAFIGQSVVYIYVTITGFFGKVSDSEVCEREIMVVPIDERGIVFPAGGTDGIIRHCKYFCEREAVFP